MVWRLFQAIAEARHSGQPDAYVDTLKRSLDALVRSYKTLEQPFHRGPATSSDRVLSATTAERGLVRRRA